MRVIFKRINVSYQFFNSNHLLLFLLIRQLYFYLCLQVLLLYYLTPFLQKLLHFLWLHPLALFLGVGKVPYQRQKKHLPLQHQFLQMSQKLYESNVLLQTQQLDQIKLLFSPPFQICFLLNKFSHLRLHAIKFPSANHLNLQMFHLWLYHMLKIHSGHLYKKFLLQI